MWLLYRFFANGTGRDVTSLAVYEPASTSVKVSHDGLVTRDGPVETAILVRYLNQHVPLLTIRFTDPTGKCSRKSQSVKSVSINCTPCWRRNSNDAFVLAV